MSSGTLHVAGPDPQSGNCPRRDTQGVRRVQDDAVTHEEAGSGASAAFDAIEGAQELYARYIELARLADVPTATERPTTMAWGHEPPAPLGLVVWNR